MNIPPELEKMLYEFTKTAITVNPPDLHSFAADYFTRLRDQERTTVRIAEDVSDSDEGSREAIEKKLGRKAFQRRGTVMGERYNPEEDEEEEEDEALEIHPKTDNERQRIKEKTKDFFLFNVLDDADLNAVIDAMIPNPVKQDELIIRQGDDGDFFYLIDSGQFNIFISDSNGEQQECGKYEDKGYFGELALLHNQPRSATIKAATDGFLWAVSRQTFNRKLVKRAFQKRQMYMKLLEKVAELKPLTEYAKMQVADALIAKSYNEGEVIVKQGDEGDGMYFIVEGTVSVRKTKDTDGYEEKSKLGVNDFFGEMALVKHQPRAATVVAEAPTKTAFLDVSAFERLLGPVKEILRSHTETYK